MIEDQPATACPRIGSSAGLSAVLVGLLAVASPWLILAVIGREAAARPATRAVFAPSAQASPSGLMPPCDLEIERSVSPRVVEAGGRVTVSLGWRYACRPEERRAVDVLLLVDISAGLNDASGRLLPQLQEGLSRVIARIPLEGSRLGLLAYDTRIRAEMPLAAGRAAFDQRLAAIHGLRNTGSGFSDPLVPLARAEEMLRQPQAPAILLLVDVGGSLPPSRDPASILDACARLRESSVRLAALSLPGANERFAACASAGGALLDSTPDVRLAPELLGGLASAWIGDPDPLLTEWHEPLDEGTWTYELGSGRPRGPDALRGAERVWQEYALAGAGDHVLRWSLRAKGVNRTAILPLTTGDGAFAALVDRAGHSETWPATRQHVCIHVPGRAADCLPFVRNMTATAAAPTPNGSLTPTPRPPTVTSTATPDPSITDTATPPATPSATSTRAVPVTPTTSAAAIWLPLGLRE